MKLKLLFLFCLDLSSSYFAQLDIFNSPFDTIKIDTKCLSKKLDSLPGTNVRFFSVNPGLNVRNSTLNIDEKLSSQLLYFYSPFQEFKQTSFKFSAVPHVGFHYAFGSKGIQNTSVNYQQMFSRKTGINIQFDKFKLGAFLRGTNSDYSTFKSIFIHRDKRIQFDQQLYYRKQDVGQNAGIDTVKFIIENPISFQEVNLNNSNSLLKQVNLTHVLKYKINKDSIKNIGISLVHQLSNNHREFFSSPAQAYFVNDSIYIDSNTTRDQFQIAKSNQGLGFYYVDSSFYFDLKGIHTYWDYQNLAQHIDTNEVDILLNSSFKKKNFLLTIDGKFNLLGAQNQKEFNLNNQLKYNYLKYCITVIYKDFYTSPFQRRYFSNHLTWTNNNTIQKERQIFATVDYSRKRFSISTIQNLLIYDELMIFDNDLKSWSSKNLQFMKHSIKSRINLNPIIVKMNCSYVLSSSSLKLPKFYGEMALFYNEKLFKDKKFDYFVGINGKFNALNSNLFFNPLLDTYSVYQNQNDKIAYNLDFSHGFQVKDFRFYMHLDNVLSLFNEEIDYQMNLFPVNPFFFRVGLTWDFFY